MDTSISLSPNTRYSVHGMITAASAQPLSADPYNPLSPSRFSAFLRFLPNELNQIAGPQCGNSLSSAFLIFHQAVQSPAVPAPYSAPEYSKNRPLHRNSLGVPSAAARLSTSALPLFPSICLRSQHGSKIGHSLRNLDLLRADLLAAAASHTG